MIRPLLRLFVLLIVSFLGGCAANQMHGFQNTYYSYNVPQPLLDRITVTLKEYGLVNARITRDSVGRVQLKGSYQNEDEVDKAFVIVQSIVGLKSTSPFYPDDIKNKRWEAQAASALAKIAKGSINKSAIPKKHALVIGINTFKDSKHLHPIQGEDDARVVSERAAKAGYVVTALLGKDATKSRIESALERMKGEVGPEDSLFIYISSHGNPPLPLADAKDERKMSIAAYDSGDSNIKEKTEYFLKLNDTSVADTKVQELAKMPTRSTRVLIDTCYSGDMLKGIPDDSSRYIEAANGGKPERASISLNPWRPDYSSKGILFKPDSGTVTSAQSSKQAQQESIDLSRFTIITATSGDQLSWGPPPSIGTFPSPVSPDRMLRGSIFTQAFFEYLDHHNGHIEPAFKAARNFTQNKVRDIRPPADYKGSVPIEQLPRLEPPMAISDQSNLYK